MDPDRTIAAAILTGGRATRLGGAPKGALEIGGRTIIDRQLEVLRAVADPVFAVSSATGATGPLDAAIETIRDALPGGGALVGIYSAITHSPRDRTLVVACDMPFLHRRVLEAMIAIDADLVIPRSARGYEPLCALYSKRCGASVRSRLERGERQASVLPEGVTVVEIGPETLAAHDPDDLMFVNVNTPHDYERANKLFERRLKASRDRIMDELGP